MKEPWREPFHIVIEVENKQCRILKKFSSLGLERIRVSDIRSSSKGSVKHLIEIDSDQAKQIPLEFRKLEPSSKIEGRSSLWFESEGCSICNTILSSDAFLVSGKSLDGVTVTYSFIAPRFEAYQKIVSDLENAGLKVNILKIGRFQPKTGVLTEKQEKIFWLAWKGGFFDYPRKIGTHELSAKLRIKPSTLSEITRRGMRRLLEHYFEKES